MHPEPFSMLLIQVFFNLLDTFAVIYFDDLFITNKTVEEYQKALDTVFVYLANQ